MTDDSEQALDLFPNRCGFNYRCDFGGINQMFNLMSRTSIGPFRASFRS